MTELPVPPEYERLAALRQATWQLLEDYTRRGPEEQDPSIIVGLQDAANHLGAVEQRLLEPPGGPLPTLTSGSAMPESRRDSAARSEQHPPITADAAIVLGLAEVLVPLATSRADEAERWLYIMRDYGIVGDALQALGMTSTQPATPSLPPPRPARGADPVNAVASEAGFFASERGASAVATIDVLFAVIVRYGSLFDRALYAATSKRRSELLAAVVGRGPVPA
jgi:hypothetical protein